MTVVQETTIVEVRQIIYKLQNVLSRLQTLFNTQFTEESISQVQDDIQACLEEYTLYLDLARYGPKLTPRDKELIDDIFNDISKECQELYQIYQRQKVKEKINFIKLKLGQISTMDTCRNYAANLENEAQNLKKSLEADKGLISLCQDLFAELEDIIIKIQAARGDINFATGVEVACGVLTLGVSCTTLFMGTAGAIASAGRAVAGGPASAAGAAVGVVSETAGEAEIAGAAAGNIARPTVKSVAALISSCRGAKCGVKTLSTLATCVGGVAKLKEFGILAILQKGFVKIKSFFNFIWQKAKKAIQSIANFFRKLSRGAKKIDSAPRGGVDVGTNRL